MEAQLLVIVGADPLGGVDCAGLQGLEDLPAGQHLHGYTQSIHDAGAEAGNAHLQPFHVGD